MSDLLNGWIKLRRTKPLKVKKKLLDRYMGESCQDFEADFPREQARARLGQNSRPRGQNFALNGIQGEVGVSLFREIHFHSVLTIYYHCIVLFLSFNGNSSMCYS